MIGRLLLRAFGIKEEEERAAIPVYKCPTCGHERPLAIRRDATDAYLNGASLDWLEAAVEMKLRSEGSARNP